MINEEITEKEVRGIGIHGEQIWIMSPQDAMLKAQAEDLDLVLIAPNAKPPVAKIIDYSKYRYEMIRKEKEAKKKQRASAARKFLEKGNKVKVTLRYRGREMSHMAQTKHVLDDFAEILADIAVIDKPSKLEGRSIVMTLSKKGN